jgi:hypothetical protein
MMEPKTVENLEEQIEEVIVQMKMGLKRLPLLPSQRTMHLLAKATVTVYEAAVESRQERES